MKTSEQINELSTALSKAQGEMDAASKSAKNPHFGNKYADLAEVWYAIREQLSKHGLAVIQTPSAEYENGAKVSVTTRLTHLSGQWIEETLTLTPMKTDPQGVGSAITYARRYALAAIVGIAQDDDDGNAASGKPSTSMPKQETAPKQQPPANSTPKPEAKPAQQAQKAEQKTEGQQPAARPHSGFEWGFQEIEAVIRPDLVAEIQRARIGKVQIVKAFNNHDGNQTAILDEWRKLPTPPAPAQAAAASEVKK